MIKTEDTFVHKEQGKKWVLPKLLEDNEGRVFGKKRTYKVLGFRYPKKHEYYLSGAIITAYLAPNDLSGKYLVIEFTEVEWIKKEIWIQKT